METDAQRRPSGEVKSLILVGNPNVGKSVIFGALTGTYVTVSNYPGTTVELTTGWTSINGRRIEVIDTPGINSLTPNSEDEQVTRDILLEKDSSAVVQIADAKNLRRALLISIQLAEMDIPFVIALNMQDEAQNRGIEVDADKLSKLFGVDVVPTVAIHRKGIDRLRASAVFPRKPTLCLRYSADIEEAIEQTAPLLPEANVSKRALALMILSGDETLVPWLRSRLPPHRLEQLKNLREEVQSRYPEPLGFAINRQRLKWADDFAAQVTSVSDRETGSVASLFGKLAMHPVWGIPILFAVLFLVYQFVGVFGAQTLVGFLEEVVFSQYINPAASAIIRAVLPVPFLRDMLVGEYGLITMALTYAFAIVLPIVATFFLAFGILEDSGYLPRLAVMVNRIFKVLGLNGKAVLPMVLGLGCDTMATLTARILETRKERLLVTLLLTLGVPCSAQLGVILGLLGSLSAVATAIWVAIVISSLALVGYIASKLLPGESSEFILELPPIRRPQISNLAVKVAARMEWYLKEAVPLFMLGTFILFASDRLGLLKIAEGLLRPVVVNLLGLPKEAAVSFLMGFLRRDYGATALYDMAQKGRLSNTQILVSVVTITFFVPCIAQFFVTAKERGAKAAVGIALFAALFAVGAGTLLNMVLTTLGISF
ncbi:MAG: ferrous iron transport protein B [Armatimonadota bacterium]